MSENVYNSYANALDENGIPRDKELAAKMFRDMRPLSEEELLAHMMRMGLGNVAPGLKR